MSDIYVTQISAATSADINFGVEILL